MHGHVRSVPSLHGPVGVDLLFSRVLGSLPAPLAQSLCEAELDEATTLRDYPRSTADQLKGEMSREGLTSQPAPSGATSSTTAPSIYGHRLHHQVLEWTGEKGGDPKTDKGDLLSLGATVSVVESSPLRGALATHTDKSSGSFSPVEMVNASDPELAVGLHVSRKTGVSVLPDGLLEIEKFKTNPPGPKNADGSSSSHLMIGPTQQRVVGHPRDSEAGSEHRDPQLPQWV